MPEPRPLRKAPIREAVIDIRVPPMGPESLEVLESLAHDLGFPVVHAGYEFRGEFDLGPEGLTAHDHQTRPNGYRAVSETHSQIVQLRTNGIGVSRLEPYRSWEDLVQDAKGVWASYREAFCPTISTRLGVRYINHIRLPYPVSDLNDYFYGIPDPPDRWPQAVSSFLFRQTLHDAVSGAAVNVVHALADDVDDDRIGVIFDIDAYLEGSFSVDDSELWGTLSDLRDLKNRVFFSGVTDATLALCD